MNDSACSSASAGGECARSRVVRFYGTIAWREFEGLSGERLPLTDCGRIDAPSSARRGGDPTRAARALGGYAIEPTANKVPGFSLGPCRFLMFCSACILRMRILNPR